MDMQKKGRFKSFSFFDRADGQRQSNLVDSVIYLYLMSDETGMNRAGDRISRKLTPVDSHLINAIARNVN